jgi:hypothetical protein
MPLPKRPHVASPDEVRITRDGDAAIIEYADPKVATTHLTVGREKLSAMTDEQILELWNDGVAATEEFVADYDYVATEIPLGKPQLRYSALADQWVPRGEVLRGEILGFASDDPEGTFISFDDRDYTPIEFAKMLSTWGGWGVRITAVPRDEMHEDPEIDVKEPDNEEPEPPR